MKEMTRKEFLKLTGASTALLAMSHIIPTSAYADTSKIDAPSAGMYISEVVDLSGLSPVEQEKILTERNIPYDSTITYEKIVVERPAARDSYKGVPYRFQITYGNKPVKNERRSVVSPAAAAVLDRGVNILIGLTKPYIWIPFTASGLTPSQIFIYSDPSQYASTNIYQGGNAMRLKNDTNNFAASFNITPPYQMLVLHSKMLIYPRELYQRGVQRKRVEMIAADFNEYVANEPKVSFRNGKYYVVDGQHTIEGRILRNGGKDLPILCKVYTGLTMEQEALFFAEQNGHSAPLTAGIKLRAKVVGGDAPSKAFLAATNRVGLAFNYDSLQLSDYRISCVGTALKLYNQMGEKIYCESLRLIVAAWEGKPDSFRASVLRGVMHFVELYHGEFSEERLIRALGNVHPMEIYRVGRDNPAKLPGWKKYVFPIYMAYNGKGRKDALSMKF